MNKKFYFIIFLFLFLLTSCTKYYYNTSLKNFENGNYEKALSNLKKIKSNELDPISLKLEGDCYYALNEIDKAYNSYYLAAELDNSILIENLIPYYFQIKKYNEIITLINNLESIKLPISSNNREIEYLSYIQLNMDDKAEEVFVKFLSNENEFTKTKLKILSSTDSYFIVNEINKFFKDKKTKEVIELIRLCNTNNLIDNNFLSLLNAIFDSTDYTNSFRSECCLYIASIFDDIGNTKQKEMYINYAKQLQSLS